MVAADPVTAALRAASNRQLAHALVRFTRAAQDHDDMDQMARNALDELLPELLRRATDTGDPDPQLREALRVAVERFRPGAGAVAVAELPALTRASAPLVTEVLLTAAVALEPDRPDHDPAGPLDEIAWTHDQLSVAFALSGRADVSVSASHRAVRVRRMLVDREGDEELPALATSLTNLSVRLSRLARHEEALAADIEATGILQRLVAEHGAEHRNALATALVNLSVSLGALGRSAEALAASTEAVALRRAVPETGTRTAADLALALHNLSVDLAAAGHDDQALDAVEEAVGIRRRLAGDEPDRFEPDLADSLNNMSVRLGALGRRTEALAAIRDAVRIRRALAAADPDRFLPDLATSLSNMSVDLNATGAPSAEALAATTEAVRIRRALAGDQPDVSAPALATALTNMATDLAAVDRPVEALEATLEAVELRRTLARRHFDRHAPGLARTLRTAAARFTPVGRSDDSVTAAQEAVEIFRSLALTRPDAFRPDLASALSSLAIRLRAVDRYPEALAANEESVGLYRELADAAPDIHLPRLASALSRLATDLTRADRGPESLTAAAEAVRIRRSLTSTGGAGQAADLAADLDGLAARLRELDRPADALATVEEIVRIRRALTPSDLRTGLPRLVSGLGELATNLTTLGRAVEADPLFTQLADEYRDNPWATGVIGLGRGWWHAERGDVTAAIADARRALDRLGADRSRLREARTLLQTMRHADPDQFDRAWDRGDGGEMPRWLRHMRHENARRALIRAWYGCTSPEQAEDFLAHNAAALLTDEALVTLERLVDDNPDNTGLRRHHDIIRAAQARGVATAYAEYRDRLWREGVQDALTTWFDASDDELRQLVEADERVLLLSEEARTQLEDGLAGEPDAPRRLWRSGLLTLCGLDGIAAAFALLDDLEALHRPPGRHSLTEFEPRLLAVTRIRAGREPDDPDAAFVHATLALLAGKDGEADVAIARCARSSTSWDRRTRARHLTEVSTVRPDLGDGWARLRSIMASPHGSADRHG